MEVENRTSEVVRWERFLPQMVLRVLVVEPDNSTRHVISALLRKCSYKVTSVSDGLEAWEALKEKRKSIDLILTEVELPSISGFTLLTLVMDHDVCKKIPVIMMSSQDSISTVLKCMLKGAADFLIKPIRKNELKNLWQHIWRRQISTAENKSLHAEEEHRKIGATSEKTAASSPSNDYILSEQEDVVCKDTKIISKDFSQMECEDTMDWSKANTNLDEECVKIDIDSGLHGSKIEFNRRDNSLLESPSLAAIDMIGSFGSGKRKFEISNFTVGISSSTCGPHLGLSLQGSNPSGPRSSEADEGRLLNHSSASAFSRYNSGNRFRLSLPSSSMVNSKAQGTVSTVNELKQVHQSYLRMAFSNNGDNCTTVIKEQSEKVENASASSLVLVQIQGSSTNLNEVYRCPSPTPLYAQACQTLARSTHLTGKPDQSVIQLSNSGSSKLQKGACADNMNAKSSIDIHERENKSQKGDCIGSVAFRPCSSNRSSINISSMCAENVEEGNEHIRNVKLDNDSGIGGATIPGIKCSGPNRMDTILSSEREAALIKFRQKRSKRCFEKKVRYESRRQLAEQRPRVKGQFVRQIQTDSAASAS